MRLNRRCAAVRTKQTVFNEIDYCTFALRFLQTHLRRPCVNLRRYASGSGFSMKGTLLVPRVLPTVRLFLSSEGEGSLRPVFSCLLEFSGFVLFNRLTTELQ
jgi:hypothetical protein